MSPLVVHRIQFASTMVFHYLFAQLTMGLALIIAYMATRAYWGGNEHYRQATQFWTKILAVTFAFGVATGVPMEFQFGTNWADFSQFAGGVIGQTLALEGVFAFFFESFFIAVLLAGGKRLGPRGHWFAAVMVFAGSWLSAYFILATNAWMQNPVAYAVASDGSVHVNDFWALLANPWLHWQYLHNQGGAVLTGALVTAGVGAFYLLSGRDQAWGKSFVATGVVIGAIGSALQIYPTGDGEARQVFERQPIKGAAMEGLFYSEQPAAMTIMGQPNMEEMRLDNPIVIPDVLSFLTYRRFTAEVKGLAAFPRERWPDQVPLVYYAYHIMVGLGTIFLAVMLVALVLLLWKRRLFHTRWMLWIILLVAPFPYIANTAGWITTELGRQPWVAYGLLATGDGFSPLVSAGNGLFSLLGFLGLYLLMGITYIFLVLTIVWRGPAKEKEARTGSRD